MDVLKKLACPKQATNILLRTWKKETFDIYLENDSSGRLGKNSFLSQEVRIPSGPDTCLKTLLLNIKNILENNFNHKNPTKVLVNC